MKKFITEFVSWSSLFNYYRAPDKSSQSLILIFSKHLRNSIKSNNYYIFLIFLLENLLLLTPVVLYLHNSDTNYSGQVIVLITLMARSWVFAILNKVISLIISTDSKTKNYLRIKNSFEALKFIPAVLVIWIISGLFYMSIFLPIFLLLSKTIEIIIGRFGGLLLGAIITDSFIKWLQYKSINYRRH